MTIKAMKAQNALIIKHLRVITSGRASKVAVVILMIAALRTGAINSASACTADGKAGVLPENNLNISVNAFETSGMSLETFNQIIDRVKGVYAPIIAAQGGTLRVVRRWADGKVNAYAMRNASDRRIVIFGGMARHSAQTPDGFALVLCHELGHHLGGQPRHNDWASSEGEADYFATLKCFRRVFADDENPVSIDTPKIVTEKCQKSFHSAAEIRLCERSTMAAQALSNVFSAVWTKPIPPLHFETPDPKVVDKNDDSHPAPQCRLDTFFQGALCDKSYKDDIGEHDPLIGSCSIENGAVFGYRPLCWYKPMTSNLLDHLSFMNPS